MHIDPRFIMDFNLKPCGHYGLQWARPLLKPVTPEVAVILKKKSEAFLRKNLISVKMHFILMLKYF